MFLMGVQADYKYDFKFNAWQQAEGSVEREGLHWPH